MTKKKTEKTGKQLELELLIKKLENITSGLNFLRDTVRDPVTLQQIDTQLAKIKDFYDQTAKKLNATKE